MPLRNVHGKDPPQWTQTRYRNRDRRVVSEEIGCCLVDVPQVADPGAVDRESGASPRSGRYSGDIQSQILRLHQLEGFCGEQTVSKTAICPRCEAVELQSGTAGHGRHGRRRPHRLKAAKARGTESIRRVPIQYGAQKGVGRLLAGSADPS